MLLVINTRNFHGESYLSKGDKMSFVHRADLKRARTTPEKPDPSMRWALLGVAAFAGLVGYCAVSMLLFVRDMPTCQDGRLLYFGLALAAPAILIVVFMAGILLILDILKGGGFFK